MPCPFPGMDPWLEAPENWPGFHDILVVVTVQILQPQLRARGYYAKPGERVWLTQPGRAIYPDVAVLRRSPAAVLGEVEAVAVAEPDEPIRIRHSLVEVHESFVEIYDAAGNRLVTGIEYLSPSNKSDGQGRQLYEQKQRELREAGVHLVEIDLLRNGPHVLEAPDAVVAILPRWDYLVNLARRGAGEFELYPVRLTERLPRIRVPLKDDDEDAVLDLAEVFCKSYDIGPYPESLAYRLPPIPPLQEDDAAWADEILRRSGLR